MKTKLNRIKSPSEMTKKELNNWYKFTFKELREWHKELREWHKFISVIQKELRKRVK